MAEGTIQVDVNKLKPHPRNELIYGTGDVSDLVTLIESRGKIITPLIVKEDFTIISGHRRWMAAKELGFVSVPCEVVSYENEEEELADLILHNASRVKTVVQRVREGMVLEESLSSEAFQRMVSTLKQNRTAWLAASQAVLSDE